MGVISQSHDKTFFDQPSPSMVSEKQTHTVTRERIAQDAAGVRSVRRTPPLSTRNSDATLASDGPSVSILPPDGGVKAWLVTFGGFSTMCCTLGYMNSFGVYQHYYASHSLSDRSPSTISWIGSLQGALLFLGGVVSGPLADRFGIRVVLIPSSTMLVLSVMLTSLCTEYWHFLLSQGLLQGLCFGLIYTPAVSTVGQYFQRRRAFAMGIVATGASIGGIVWPIIISRMVDSLGFGWTIRVVGFVMFALLSFACLVMVEHAPRRSSKLLLPEAFRNGAYVAANIGFFLTLLGMWAPIFFIADYTASKGITTASAFYEVAVLNGMSFFGRCLSGAMADRLGRFNMYIGALLGTSILLFCWTAATNLAGVTVFVAFYGIFSGAVVSLYPPCIAQICPRAGDIGTYIGMGLALSSVTGLAAGPVNGALITRFGFLHSSLFSGAMVFVAVVCTVLARLIVSRKVLCAV